VTKKPVRRGATEPRPRRTGTIFRYQPAKPGEKLGHYVVRCSAPDGTRPLFHLDPSPESPKARATALHTAEGISESLFRTGEGAAPRRQRATRPGSDGETITDYADRWFKDRERRGLSSVGTDRSRFATHVEPVLGARPIRDVDRDEIRALVERMDDRVRQAKCSWTTAGKAWGLVTKLFSDACNAKTAALRVRPDNPTAGVPGPDRGERKAKQWLYPSEVSALLACPKVPQRWRRLYALAVYLYLRPGELAALDWADVNAAQRYVSVHQALDIRTSKIKATKTGITRKVPIHPALEPLLTAMREEFGDAGRVVQNEHENQGKKHDHGFPPLEDLAATLRTHLTRAGVERADLHDDRTGTKRVTFYDLRATGITWEVLAGTDHVRIMQRAGHRNFSTTQGYIREAEAVGLDAGAPFPTLPPELSQKLSQLEAAPAKLSISKKKRSVPKGIRTWSNPDFLRGFQHILKRSGAPILGVGEAKSATLGARSLDRSIAPLPSDALGAALGAALAGALERAAAAGEWDAVKALAAELAARRGG
jgi:integrase